MSANQSIRAGHIRAASSSSLHPPVSGARGRAARARSGSYANMRCQLIRFSPSISLPPRLRLPLSLALTHTSCVACLFLSLCLRTYKVPRVNQLELFSFPISYADSGRAASATRVAAAACTYVCLFGQGTTRASAQEAERPSEWGGSTWLKLRTNKRRERRGGGGCSVAARSLEKKKKRRQSKGAGLPSTSLLEGSSPCANITQPAAKTYVSPAPRPDG